MTDFNKLMDLINESGMPMTVISERSGIRRETLYNRLKGKGEFTVSEIVGLCNALKIAKTEREKIFFSKLN